MASIKHKLKLFLYHAQLWRLARILNRHKAPILMYHGLTKDNQKGDWVHVHQTDFEEQMSYLRTKYNPVSLSNLLEMINTNKIVPYSVVVTFDDGYRSIPELALPILKRYNIPATIYLTTGFMADSNHEKKYLWADRVLMLTGSGDNRTIELDDFGMPSISLGNDAEARKTVYRLIEQLKLAENKPRLEVIGFLEKQLGDSVNDDGFEHCLPMTWDDAKKLSQEPLIEIGAHSSSHPILSRLDAESLKAEVTGCKEELEHRLGRPINHFAYPNGRMIDIGNDALEVAKKYYNSATTTESGLARNSDNRWLFPRIGIGRDMPMAIFKQKLAGLF